MSRSLSRRLRRWLVRTVVAVLLLLIVGGLALYLSLNRLLKRTVEQQATRSMNLSATVGSASLALLGGNLHLDEFRIASPPGFSDEPLLLLTGADMGMTYGQLRSNPVRIASITFTRPRLVVEQVGGRLNIKKMVEQLPPPAPRPMRLVIDEVRVVDATVILRPGVPGLAREIAVPVPTFTLNHIGSGEGSGDGATVREVVLQLVTALAAHASNSDAAPPELRALLKGDVRAVLAQLGVEAQRQILKVVPGDARKVLGGLLAPAGAKGRADWVPGFLSRRPATGPSIPATRPATEPAR